MTVRSYAGAAKRTTLSAGINNAALSFTVTAGGGTGYPTGLDGPFVVLLDHDTSGEEKVLCSGRSGDTFTVAAGGRGYDDTVASAHSLNAPVDHVGAAVDFREANVHANATGAADPHPGYVQDAEIAGMVTLTGTQTLSNKTITQAQTHYSPDTDSAPTALHHTLGTGANQAAAGNHSHSGLGGTTDASWAAPTYANSWSDYVGTGGYRRQSGIVLLRGGLHNGTAGAMFTLPAGFRPIQDLQFLVARYDGTSYSSDMITVSAGGVVTSNYVPPGASPGLYVLLNSIRFLAEQ